MKKHLRNHMTKATNRVTKATNRMIKAPTKNIITRSKIQSDPNLQTTSDITGFYNRFFESDKFLSPNQIKRINNLAQVFEHTNKNHRAAQCAIYPLWNNLWIFNKIVRFVSRINKTNWAFELNKLSYVTVLKYDGDNKDKIGWHMDVGTSSKSKFDKNKITCVIQLSDPASYQGGMLQIFNHGICNVDKRLGSVVVFPSYYMHRVTTVTKGVRYVLVAIFEGNQGFR
jgi:hypothetical protein